MKLLIIGEDAGTGIGGSLYRAALKQSLTPMLLNSNLASGTNALLRRIYWHALGRRPVRLRSFSERAVLAAVEHGADLVIATGLAPLDLPALMAMRAQGIKTANFLTDDPWNSAHRAPWFRRALPAYDSIFSPRRANIADLQNAGCRKVHYLPFGYDEDIFYRDPAASGASHDHYASDVYFAGGADRDRVPYLGALIGAGLEVHLHGGYWDRYEETRAYNRGHADASGVRRGLNGARIGLCLVRRANRDGNCMRTFEVPACGTCLLAEDTDEHREIFGREGEAAVFFSSVEQMVAKAKLLIGDDDYRRRIALAGHALITGGRNTYGDRLLEICSMAGT